jgi:hypothetical protein
MQSSITPNLLRIPPNLLRIPPNPLQIQTPCKISRLSLICQFTFRNLLSLPYNPSPTSNQPKRLPDSNSPHDFTHKSFSPTSYPTPFESNICSAATPAQYKQIPLSTTDYMQILITLQPFQNTNSYAITQYFLHSLVICHTISNYNASQSGREPVTCRPLQSDMASHCQSLLYDRTAASIYIGFKLGNYIGDT